jgi:fumarate reductase iron-sulfur subunit
MLVRVQREAGIETFEIDQDDLTIPEALNHIKEHHDTTLTFNQGCRSGVCGSCAIRVNGKEQLSCTTKLHDNDLLEPLRYIPVIRDLVVDHTAALEKNQRAKAYLNRNTHQSSSEDEAMIRIQSDCILCGSCYSACPVFEISGDFLGPFALTRAFRYIQDKREDAPKGKIEAIQTNGIWDCTLCGECSLVCPQSISPKDDINILRTKSGVMGYQNPQMQSFGDFGGFDGGFSPNF